MLPPMGDARSAKLDFVVRAQCFANRTPARARRFILAASAMVLAAIAGPFGTTELTAYERLVFWSVVPSCAFVFWELWFALGRRRNWSWKKTLFRGLLPNEHSGACDDRPDVAIVARRQSA